MSAIVESVKARIKQIEGELAQHQRLSEELERLREALGSWKGRRDRGWAGVGTAAGRRPPRRSARDRPARRRRGPRSGAVAAGATEGTSAPASAPRGQNKAKVLEALKDGPMTASEVAKATGVATGSASTLLTKLSKTGEVVKAERGYRLPDARSSKAGCRPAPG